MNELLNIRLELGINAQKIIQQVKLNNGNVESQIAKGIELALNDLCDGDNFVQQVREATKLELANVVHKAIVSWVQQSLLNIQANAMSTYSQVLAERISWLNVKQEASGI